MLIVGKTEYDAVTVNNLGEIIKQAGKLSDFTVLSPQVDPYRYDTPANHRDGRWFADQLSRLHLLERRLHLRGIHYALLGSTLLPNGGPYTNTAECWDFLEASSKAARWLKYVRFESIVDARNDPPIIRVRPPELKASLYCSPEIMLPEIDDIRPRIHVEGFVPRQPYRLAFYGEKTSLEPILGPLAARFDADLYLPTGEISNTQMYAMAATAAADGRELITFVLADFDPAGYQMAVSIGRKLQAFRDGWFPKLRYRLYPIALTEAQVREFELPSTPLKATERRADRWREAHGGLEQTEIDALATLRPQMLERIVEDALRPFRDQTLASRVHSAREVWLGQAQSAIDDQLSDEARAGLLGTLEAEIEHIREQLEAIEQEAATAVEDLEIALPELALPEPQIDIGLQPEPLISSDWPWSQQTQALNARKRYA